ncbi:phage tail protein [Niastella caeni]|uniref:Phage tail protein n=1 Tax=Niastella caeni TaxID=2569763 RepID=A0A4V4H1J4_9BACT|nr:tail fiber protein [Niastella caeni]THU40786.1 phage tail protein [Niastella caeni]
MEPFLGEIKMWGGNFAPVGFAFCNGQLMSIAQNTALFSLLGTTYGGDGRTTFALPNLQGRLPMHWGNGPGLSPKDLGQAAGEETVNLLITQIPAHNHLMNAGTGTQPGTGANTPANNYNGVYIDPNSGSAVDTYSTVKDAVMNPASIAPTGGSQPHDNMPPYLCVSFIIATQGIFPSRD